MNSDESISPAQVFALCGLLFLIAFAVVFSLSSWSAAFVVWDKFDNLYFHADIALVFSNMTDFGSNHYRTGMHPGFSLLTAYSVAFLQGITGVDGFRAVQLVLALNAGVQTVLLFVLLRRLSLTVIPAVGFTLLFLVSAALMFWHTIAETFAFGGTTLLIMLLIASARMPGAALLMFGNVVSMSMTMTNWMVAFYGTVWHRWRQWRQVLTIFVSSGALIVLIGIVSKLIFPSSGYTGDFRRYLAWVRLPQAGDWPAFFGHSMVMPEPVYHMNPNGTLAVTVETAALASGTLIGPVALMLWLALLVVGAFGLWHARFKALSAVLGLTVLSQLGLHSFFSDGPFLFAAHFTPLLVLVAAHAVTLPRMGRIALPLLVAAILLVGYNNFSVFSAAVAHLNAEMLPWLQENGVQ